jgi:hypothetical protein
VAPDLPPAAMFLSWGADPARMTSEPLAPATREGVPVAWPEVPPGDVRTPLEVGLCAVWAGP